MSRKPIAPSGKIFVPSRYRSAKPERSRDCSTLPPKGPPSASSPKGDKKVDLNIHDSVASVIDPSSTPSLMSGSNPRLHRCHSMSDLRGTRLLLSESEIKHRSYLAIWTFLLEHSERAVEEQRKKEETLRTLVTERRDREAWLNKWLRVQKSIDLQVEIFQNLLELMVGETGLINLLRHFHDDRLFPVSDRLPLESVALGEDLKLQLDYATSAQECFVAAVEGELKGLDEIVRYLNELASVILSSCAWVTSKEVRDKLTQACQLCLHIASLRVHRLQKDI